MIYYENIIFYRDSSHNAVLFIIDSLTLFRDKKIHINNDFIVLFKQYYNKTCYVFINQSSRRDLSAI